MSPTNRIRCDFLPLPLLDVPCDMTGRPHM